MEGRTGQPSVDQRFTYLPDTIGQVTGARSLRQLQLDKQYLAGTLRRPWNAEQFADRDGHGLNVVRQEMDVRNAQDRAWFLRWENMELHALLRDRRYATRSRRWLYTRAYQSKLKSQQEIWLQFVRWNSDLEESDKYLSSMLKADPLTLAQQPFADILQLPSASDATATI